MDYLVERFRMALWAMTSDSCPDFVRTFFKEQFSERGIPFSKTKSDYCPVCGKRHEKEWPHYRNSLGYQYKFYDEHGRWPSWADAMAHCPEPVKNYCKDVLSVLGIPLEESTKAVIRR